MPKISDQDIYLNKLILSLEDYFIGTDPDTPNKTQTYAIKALLNLFNTTYRFSNALPALPTNTPGYFYSLGQVADPKAATKLTFNNSNLNAQSMSGVFQNFIESGIFSIRLTNASDRTNIVIFDCTNFAVNDADSFSFDVANKASFGDLIGTATYVVEFELASNGSGQNGEDGQDGADGEDGSDGLSAYQIAVNNGFVGTESEWLISLKGEDGSDGIDGENGNDGNAGLSAYQIALNGGFVGTENEWLLSLKGDQGEPGINGADGTNGTNGVDGTDGNDGADGTNAFETITADVEFNGFKVTGLGDAVDPNDAVNFAQAQTITDSLKAIANTWSLKQTFTTAPRFSSVTAGQYLKSDGSKDLTSVSGIPAADVTESVTQVFVTPAEKAAISTNTTAIELRVVANSPITGATKTKVTYDAKGLVTSGSDATQDDIGDGTTFKQYSATDKTKLAGISSGATVNSSDATLLARANHTGTQLAATISDFNSAAVSANATAIADAVNMELRLRNLEKTFATDFFNATSQANDAFTGAAVTGGSSNIAFATQTPIHQGVLRITSSASANSGFLWATSTLAFMTVAGMKFNGIFKTAGTFTTITSRIGFLDTTGSADNTNGMYFEIQSDGQVYGKTANNGTRTTSAALLTLTVDTWYHFRVTVVSASSVVFTIFNDAGTQVGTQTVSTNLPTTSPARYFGCGVISTNAGTSAIDLIYPDYISFTLPAAQRGSST